MSRRVLGVMLPLVFQLLFVAVIILATNGTGSFVGLAALLLAVRIFWITAIIPAFLLFLLAVAS